MKFLNEAALRLKEPSGSGLALLMSLKCETSRVAMVRRCSTSVLRGVYACWDMRDLPRRAVLIGLEMLVDVQRKGWMRKSGRC